MRDALRAFVSGLVKYLSGAATDSFGFDVVKVEERDAFKEIEIGQFGCTVIEVMYRVPYRFSPTGTQSTVVVKRVRMVVEILDVEEIKPLP